MMFFKQFALLLMMKKMILLPVSFIESERFTLEGNVPTGVEVKTDSYCCRNCAVNVFKELVYYYRKHIPKSELPSSVTKRPDCWFGRECRTRK